MPLYYIRAARVPVHPKPHKIMKVIAGPEMILSLTAFGYAIIWDFNFMEFGGSGCAPKTTPTQVIRKKKKSGELRQWVCGGRIIPGPKSTGGLPPALTQCEHVADLAAARAGKPNGRKGREVSRCREAARPWELPTGL